MILYPHSKRNDLKNDRTRVGEESREGRLALRHSHLLMYVKTSWQLLKINYEVTLQIILVTK